MDVRFVHPPQAGIAPSHRLLRTRHSSQAMAPRLRVALRLRGDNLVECSLSSRRRTGHGLPAREIAAPEPLP